MSNRTLFFYCHSLKDRYWQITPPEVLIGINDFSISLNPQHANDHQFCIHYFYRNIFQWTNFPLNDYKRQVPPALELSRVFNEENQQLSQETPIASEDNVTMSLNYYQIYILHNQSKKLKVIFQVWFALVEDPDAVDEIIDLEPGLQEIDCYE